MGDTLRGEDMRLEDDIQIIDESITYYRRLVEVESRQCVEEEE